MIPLSSLCSGHPVLWQPALRQPYVSGRWRQRADETRRAATVTAQAVIAGGQTATRRWCQRSITGQDSAAPRLSAQSEQLCAVWPTRLGSVGTIADALPMV